MNQLEIADWVVNIDEGPIVATAIHNGHEVRPEIAAFLALDKPTRVREEDPHSCSFTEVAPTRVCGRRSRFEVDLNRPRDEAICVVPEDCWDLEVWDQLPPSDVIERSRAEHDAFYDRFAQLLKDVEQRHGGVLVLDLHSYNHRRSGPDAPADDPQANPEVNVGTGSMDRELWRSLVDRFITELSARDLDVRENVRFKGRYLAAFVHETLPRTGCCIAVEFKKTYVDEWTGRLDSERLRELVSALATTVPGLTDELHRLTSKKNGDR